MISKQPLIAFHCWEQDSGVTQAGATEWWKWHRHHPLISSAIRHFWKQSVKDFCLLISKVAIKTLNHGLACLGRTVNIIKSTPLSPRPLPFFWVPTIIPVFLIPCRKYPSFIKTSWFPKGDGVISSAFQFALFLMCLQRKKSKRQSLKYSANVAQSPYWKLRSRRQINM